MAATRGRVVQTPTMDQPYKVVFQHENGVDTEQAVATMREGEALIKSETPAVLERDRSRDEPAHAL